MDLKILAWNVEHFKDEPARMKRIAKFVEAETPDIFGLMEVEGKTVFGEFTKRFPNYNFSITEGKQSQEIMIGWKNGLSAFMTQRNEFKRSNPYLRPGALLTVQTGATKPLTILFAHLKSSPSPEGYGLRDAMFIKVRKLKKKLDEAVGTGGAKFLLLGDLNTMGMDLSFSKKDQTGPEEIKRMKSVFKSSKLSHQTPSHPATWSNGSNSRYDPAELDHVFASDNVKLKDLGGGVRVRVAGWAEKTTVAQQDKWIRDFSDHTPLIFEAQGV